MSAIGNQPNLPPVLASPVSRPIGPATQAPNAGPGSAPGRAIERPFSDLLREAEQKTAAPAELRFSRHALARLQKRGIAVDQSTINRLNGAVTRAAAKGSRDAVVLVGGAAFVVSIANRTVLTAVAPEQMRDQIFTNIDSAVIA